MWTGCASDPRITVTGDASVTGRTIDHWQDSERFRYGTIEDLGKVATSLPPIPPMIRIIPGTPGSPGAPGAPAVPGAPGMPSPGYNPAIYNQLLSFLQGGPGGGQITLAHLQQLTPSLLALGQYYYGNPGLTLNQLLASPQAGAFLSSAQSILQPLGLWNVSTLNQWATYVGQRLGTLQSILSALYGNLNMPPPPGTPGSPGTPGTPGTPGIPGVPDQIIVTAVNPLAVVGEIVKLFKSKDWLLFAERSPRLIHSLTRHAGFSFPRIALYGSRSRLYAPSVTMTRRVDGDRVAYGLNQEGFFVNEQASGSGIFYQGPDDISLVYALIDIEDGKVRTLDAVASDRYAFLKRASGGDINLLDRAATFSTGMLKADVALGEDHNYHLGVAAGTTPFATMGGVTSAIEYGAGDGIFEGRISLSAFAERAYDSDAENLLGYLDTENKLRTPYFTLKDEERKNAPELSVWGSLTLSAAGLVSYTLTDVERAKKDIGRTVGGQGDVRLVPEIHTSLDTLIFRFELYSGVTLAVVPHGSVDLDVPQQSLRLYPIRFHVGGAIRLKLSNTAVFAELQQNKRGLTDEQRDAEENLLDPKQEWIFLSLTGVGEFSRLFHKSRTTLSLDFLDYSVGAVVETESYLDENFDDVRVGAGVKAFGFYARGLRSIKDDDYRVEAGFELTF
jgi:hypothetical protein